MNAFGTLSIGTGSLLIFGCRLKEKKKKAVAEDNFLWVKELGSFFQDNVKFNEQLGIVCSMVASGIWLCEVLE